MNIESNDKNYDLFVSQHALRNKNIRKQYDKNHTNAENITYTIRLTRLSKLSNCWLKIISRKVSIYPLKVRNEIG